MGQKILGRPMMPWQRYVLDVALELDPDGHPAYRRVVLTVPRQSGKTTLQLALFVHRALAWGRPQTMAYAAQTGSDARKKLIDQPDGQIPILQRSPFRRLFRPRLTNGHEAIMWANGSRHGLAANTAKSGHGGTLDLALIDEAFAQVDARLEQAFSPAMVTVQDAQLWVVSTAGTPSSRYLKAKVDSGRLGFADTDSGTAYFEWSAPDDAPIDDPATWWGCMPALGITVSERVIRSELDSMRADDNEAEFRRAYLNQWIDAKAIAPDDVLARWPERGDPRAKIAGPVSLGVAVSHDSRSAAIVACGADSGGRPVVDLIEWRTSGTAWLADRLDALRKKHTVSAVAVVKGQPAESLNLPDVRVMPAVDFGGACVSFARAVAEGPLAHVTNADGTRNPLDTAVDVAVRKFVGEGWRWSLRESRGDITPLVGAVVALALHSEGDYDPLNNIG